MTPFKCQKCGGPYFSRDVVADQSSPHGVKVLDTVRCNGDSSGGQRRCDWRGEWPPRKEDKKNGT